MKEINSYEELNKVISSNKKCFIKIGTPYCGPCQLIEQNIKNIENSYNDICFIKINADECDDKILDEYNINTVPVIVYVIDGEVKDIQTGLLNEDDLRNILK